MLKEAKRCVETLQQKGLLKVAAIEEKANVAAAQYNV